MSGHVVMFSGGVGSWAAAKRVAEAHGTEGLVLLFTDTLIEDADTYRFLREAAANVGAPLVEIADGRTPWEVFRDVRFLGNSRVDPCSRVLKRDLADAWLAEHYEPEQVTVYVGIDWSEVHRFDRLRARKLPWIYEAPLCDPPYLTKDDLHEWAEREGLDRQRLYQLGMPHANCGGGCIKMGHGGFARLLAADPCRFTEWEENEQRLREQLGDVSILKDRTGGTATPLTLTALRERIEGGGQVDMFDIGGCGCFTDADLALEPHP
jgi:3'-phosphoadenosine 5'-phosphosulfate sulfotransferase (PAPS reductase)/FAD synthetase